MRRYGTRREFDALVEQLERRGDVENPFALANWILKRRADNPGHRWEPSGSGWRCSGHGARFELLPEAAPGALDLDSNWQAWTLRADGDVVAVFQLPADDPETDDARQVAEAWIEAWAFDWSS